MNNDISTAFIKAAEVRKNKQKDYCGIIDYFPFGDKSYVQMIHVKTKRLVSLVDTEVIPENESLEDNLIDLINYASYYWEWLKGELHG